MISREEMVRAFPFVAEMEQREQARLLSATLPKQLSDGEVLAREGAACAYLPFILSGTLRVYKVGEQGKELTIYRVERGESCILTATCILNRGEFPAVARAEGTTEVLLVPAALFVAYVDAYPQWRRYLFGLYSKRLDLVLSVVEEVAFHHVDSRIAAFLADTARGDSIRATHQQIASEIGSSREVVSRILKDFEADGLIASSRGMIRVVDRGGLEERAEM